MQLISTEKLIEEAKQQGVDFGKGDPYNRLRYYTKMGWLPHMIRKKGEEGNDVKGHYPIEALDRLILIEKLKAKNLSNEEITGKIQSTTKWNTLATLFNLNKVKNKIIIYAILGAIAIIVFSELGLIQIGKPKDQLKNQVISNTDVTDN